MNYRSAALLVTSLLISHTAIADNEYMVEKGDSLYKIGQLLGVPYEAIMRANDLEDETIYPDQILIIPAAGRYTGDVAVNEPFRGEPDESSIVATPVPVSDEAIAEPSPAAEVASASREDTYSEAAYIPPVQGKSKARPRTSNPSQYIVQAGDSILSISKKFGISPWDLRKANDIKFAAIHVGQALKLPDSSAPVAIAATAN